GGAERVADRRHSYAGRHQRALLAERREAAGDASDLIPQPPADQVDGVDADVAERPGPGRGAVEAPDAREARVGQPALRVRHVDVVDLAERALVEQLLDVAGRGDEAVDEVDRVVAAGLAGGAGHRARVVDRDGEWFLAHDVLAGGERVESDGVMGVVGGGDVDRFDPGDSEQVAVVGDVPGDAPPRRNV